MRLRAATFRTGEPDRYRGWSIRCFTANPYLLLADFADTLAEQQRVDRLFQAPDCLG